MFVLVDVERFILFVCLMGCFGFVDDYSYFVYVCLTFVCSNGAVRVMAVGSMKLNTH